MSNISGMVIISFDYKIQICGASLQVRSTPPKNYTEAAVGGGCVETFMTQSSCNTQQCTAADALPEFIKLAMLEISHDEFCYHRATETEILRMSRCLPSSGSATSLQLQCIRSLNTPPFPFSEYCYDNTSLHSSLATA